MKSTAWAKIDTMTTVPLGRVTCTDWDNVTPTPATSNVTSTPFSVCSLIKSTGFVLPELTTCVAPTSLALAKRSSDKSNTKILLAPAALAATIVNKPIGPAPNTATVSPNNNLPSLTAWTATAVGSTKAPSLSDTLSGNAYTFSSGAFVNSAKPPSEPKPINE